MPYWNDDGTEVNPNDFPLPTLCMSCKRRHHEFYANLGCNTGDRGLPFLGGRNSMFPIYSETKALSAYFYGGQTRLWERCSSHPTLTGGTLINNNSSQGACVQSSRVIASLFLTISDN